MHRDGEGCYPTSLTARGEKVSLSDVSIDTSAAQQGILRMLVSGQIVLAHIARQGENWWVHVEGRTHLLQSQESSGGRRRPKQTAGSLSAPMPGTIVEVLVVAGQSVTEGDALIVMEAMKMEHRIHAPLTGSVKSVHYDAGDKVERGETLIDIE